MWLAECSHLRLALRLPGRVSAGAGGDTLANLGGEAPALARPSKCYSVGKGGGGASPACVPPPVKHWPLVAASLSLSAASRRSEGLEGNKLVEISL